MTDAIAPRSDGEGQWIDGPIGLGHICYQSLRLSANGSQPMVSRSSLCNCYT